MDFSRFTTALSPARNFASKVANSLVAKSPVSLFGSKPKPSFPSAADQPLFVKPPVSSAVFPSATASVIASAVPAASTLTLTGKRRIGFQQATPAVLVVAPDFAASNPLSTGMLPETSAKGRGRGRGKEVVVASLAPVPDDISILNADKKKPRITIKSSRGVVPVPVPVPVVVDVAPAQTEKEVWLKNYEEEEKANKEFLKNQEKVKELQVEQQIKEETGETIDEETKRQIDMYQKREERIAKIKELKIQKREQNLANLVGIIKAKAKRDKTKRGRVNDDDNHIFEDVSDQDIATFIEKQIPPDAVSVLDTLETLSQRSAEEIADFVILKFKSLMVNSPANEPHFESTLNYNKTAIKSLPGLGAGATHVASRGHALLVCEPRCHADQAAWCCNLQRSHPRVAEIVQGQVRPYVDANPDIEDMMNQCFRARAASRAAAPAGFFAAAAPAPGGDSDDPFPSLLVGEENIIYSIGPIIDANSILGRPFIMIRIHNYKKAEYPDGIYFWAYPSFSEGGANRVFLMIGGKQFMKGPDYTLTTFILDLLQVHINKYYTKHFVDKQGNFNPTILGDIREIICFFGEMIHLQTQWVHDLIAGRGLNLGPNPLVPVPANFNRHCYRVSDQLFTDGFNQWFTGGIPNVESYSRGNIEIARYANQFCSMNKQFRDRATTSSFPLCFCLTTILDRFDDGQGGTRNLHSFNDFYKDWPNIFFVQGSRVYRKASPTACVLSGAPSSVKGMRSNIFLEQLSTLEIAKRLKSHLLLPPITTFETGMKISAFPMISRSGAFLLKTTLGNGHHFAIKECRLLHVDFEEASLIINNMLKESSFMANHDKARIIFCKLPKALKKTIQIICANVFNVPIPVNYCNVPIFNGVHPLSPVPSIPDQSVYPLVEKQKVKECFKKLLEINADPRNVEELLVDIIIKSVGFDRSGSIEVKADGEVIIPNSPLDRLRRTLDTGIYRHVLMSSILDEYTEMASFPLDIGPVMNPELNPNVRCSFLNENGQYVELQGGVGGFGGNCDFSGIFERGLAGMPGVYIFTATRDSKTFPDATLRYYMDNPRQVNPSSAHSHANISIKVHTKMFLLRLVFSNYVDAIQSVGAIQIIVCVSSTICVANPGGGQAPSIPFGVDVQFNVVSIGPVDVAAGGSASTHATILATMCEYLSLGCMGAAKKGEYSLTAGYQQFFDYFDNFFRLIITECYTYVSAYISAFNSGKDIIMKHFHGVFENCGTNPISDAIRGMWGWRNYLQRVQPGVCVGANGLTPASIDDALRNCRCNMQLAVQALLDPILEQLDEHTIGEITGGVASEIDSVSSSGRSESSASSSSGASSMSGKLLGQLLGDTLSSTGSDASWSSSMGRSQDSRDSTLSADPIFQDMGGEAAQGGTNKKTRKYKTNRRSKSKSKSKSKPKHTNIRRRIRTRTQKNTQVSRTKTKTKTMKIKSKKFPKRIYLYSTPRTAQRMAYKYLGRIKTAKLYPARNPAKKYMIFDPKNNKWVNFGQMGYEDYTKHHDKTRRKNYLTRTKGMLGDWKSNKYSANNLSRSILWT
jgi:hypothetical protein